MPRFPAPGMIALLGAVLMAVLPTAALHAAEQTDTAKPITPDNLPSKLKAIENPDGSLKAKITKTTPPPEPAGKSSGKTGKSTDKEELSPEELANRIASKMAELHKENEARAKAQLVQAKRNPTPAQPHAAALAADNSVPTHPVAWGYEGEGGAQRWGKIDPANAKCETGERQSPIDIRDGIRVDLDPVVFDYKPVRFNVVDNGHTIMVNVSAGNSISILGRRYDLVQFHFHRPAEERVNGTGYDMVAHLVHKDVDGKLVVIAVLIQQGKANSLVQTIWNYLPLEKNDTVQAPGTIDLNQILPAGRGYFTYMGSLTTPPCSEGVLWVVYKEPIELSADQIGIFSRLYPMNARPIQNSSGRLIKESN
jgi:carbonic anhydrase